MFSNVRKAVVIYPDSALQAEINYTPGNGHYAFQVVREEGNPALLGKRYICGHLFQITENNVTRSEYKAGFARTPDGDNVYLGCGTEALCIKASAGNAAAPYCCDMPMSLQQPKVLPSAD